MKIVTISSSEEFERFRREIPVFLADFWKDRCVNCKMLDLSFQKFGATPTADGLTVAKLKLEELGEDLFYAQSVRQAPTLILYRGGKEAARASGFISPEKIAALVSAC